MEAGLKALCSCLRALECVCPCMLLGTGPHVLGKYWIDVLYCPSWKQILNEYLLDHP